MSKVTYIAVGVVWISILGERKKPFPACREDSDDIIGRLLKWLGKNDIHPVHQIGGVTGGSQYCHAFREEDADKITDWLKTQGVKRRKTWN